MQIVSKPITIKNLKQTAADRYGNLVKAVVDLEKQTMAIDAEMHADEEAELIKNGSQQSALWGINLYPDQFGTADFIEFDSMINLRPSQNNKTRGVDDEKTKNKIINLVTKLVTQ